MKNTISKFIQLAGLILIFFMISGSIVYGQLSSNSHTVDGTTFTYGQNSTGQSLDIQDARGVITRYSYNELGLIAQEQSAERGFTENSYDEVGNIIRKVSEGGLTFKYKYDDQNRVVKEVMKQNGVDRKVNRFSYDNCENGIGLLCKVISDGNVTKYAYNENGNYTKISTKYVDEDSFEITSYTYTENDQLESLLYPTGLMVRYHYSDEGFVHKVTGQYGSGDDRETFVIAKNIKFDLISNTFVSLKFGNGLKLIHKYDSNKLLEGMRLFHGRNLVSSSTYQRDENLNITLIKRLNANYNQRFTYDELGYLLAEQTGAGIISYSYDEVGNRLSREEGGRSKSYTYAPTANRVEQINRKNLSYDMRGNLLSDYNGKRSFSYDVTNRMTEFYKNGTLKASYDYNASGQRIRKKLHRASKAEDSHKTFHFAYNPQGRLLSENGKNSSKNRIFARDYVWLGNLPLAQIERKIRPNGTPLKAKLSYLHADHLNAPRSATNENAEIVWNWRSDAFGSGSVNRDVDEDGHNTVIRLRFPGQYYDHESRLFYNHNRDYDPKLGRYIQSDPIGLNGGVNRYAYVNNNPVNYIDRLGLYAAPAVCESGVKAGTGCGVYTPDAPREQDLGNAATLRSGTQFNRGISPELYDYRSTLALPTLYASYFDRYLLSTPTHPCLVNNGIMGIRLDDNQFNTHIAPRHGYGGNSGNSSIFTPILSQTPEFFANFVSLGLNFAATNNLVHISPYGTSGGLRVEFRAAVPVGTYGGVPTTWMALGLDPLPGGIYEITTAFPRPNRTPNTPNACN